jgi:predicted RNase H-like HicB family nuclease
MADEYKVHLMVEALPEGQFLATSEDLPGLVAQGRSVAETIDIARDVARKLLESYAEHGDPLPPGLKPVADRLEVDVAVGI